MIPDEHTTVAGMVEAMEAHQRSPQHLLAAEMRRLKGDLLSPEHAAEIMLAWQQRTNRADLRAWSDRLFAEVEAWQQACYARAEAVLEKGDAK